MGELIQLLRQFGRHAHCGGWSERDLIPIHTKQSIYSENGYTEGVFQSDKNGIEVVVLQMENEVWLGEWSFRWSQEKVYKKPHFDLTQERADAKQYFG